MKKFFTLLALATMAASWTTMSARWIVGERKNASQIHAGDTVVLQLAYRQLYSDRYLQIADENYPDLDLMIAPGLGVGSAAVITFEEGPNDIRGHRAHRFLGISFPPAFPADDIADFGLSRLSFFDETDINAGPAHVKRNDIFQVAETAYIGCSYHTRAGTGHGGTDRTIDRLADRDNSSIGLRDIGMHLHADVFH